MDDLDQEARAERARRPGGTDQQCKNCCYWEVKNSELEELKNEGDKAIYSDVYSYCHRHAPGAAQYSVTRILGLLAMIAWAVEKTANVSHNDNIHYEEGHVGDGDAEWPRTRADDWCGDFQERTRR